MRIISHLWFLGIVAIVFKVVGFNTNLFAILVPCFIYGIISQLVGAEEPLDL